MTAPARDCPVCPHRISDHDVTGCVGAGLCACAVPGSELELAALRAGRVLADHERARDLVIDDAPGEPEPLVTADSVRDSSETASRQLESVDEGPETGEESPLEPETGELPDRGGDETGPGSPPGELDEPGEPGDASDTRGSPAIRPVPDGRRSRIYDWPAIKRRYVEGHPASDGSGVTEWPSLDAVAAHFGLPPKRIREKSAIEGWVGARQKWQAQLEATRHQARAAALSKSATDIDNRALQSAQIGLQLCLAVLGDKARQVQNQQAENVGNAGARVTMSALELSRLAQAVDLWHRIGLRAVGDPEVHRLEVTGAGGRPIAIEAELRRDDPNRLAGVLSVLTAAGLGDLFGGVDPRGALEARPGDDGVYSTEPPGR